jgi:hypothetical protein
MIILGLLVLAGVLTAAAFILRPPALAGTNGHHRWSPVVDLLDHVRDTGRRLAHRNGANGDGTQSESLTIKELAAPPAGSEDQFLEGFDLRSVAQFGIRFFGALAAAGCVGFAIVWAFASVVGVVGDLEQLMRDIGFEGFTFLSIQVILGVVLLAAAVVALLVTLSVVAAALYNVLARRSGGIRIYTSQGVPAAANGNGAKTKSVTAGDATVATPARRAG